MALVILSHNTLASTRTRTVSVRLFIGLLSAALLAMLVVGLAAGSWLTAWFASPPPVMETAEICPAAEQPEIDPSWLALAPPDSRVLINRLGELSGRVVQLELEAADLAGRIDLVKEFEARMSIDDAEHKPGRRAKTQPGAPAGGPWLKPLDQEPDALGVPAPPLEDGTEDLPMSDELAKLEEDIGRLGGWFGTLEQKVNSVKSAHMYFPGRPPVTEVPVASNFGNRIDPFRFQRAFHSGVDYTAPKGTPIHASGGGKVLFAGYRSQYGYTVEIEHGGGLVTRYAHASKLLVKSGQIVMPGQMIARIGATGRATGPHLHFEILQDGRFVNPIAYLGRF